MQSPHICLSKLDAAGINQNEISAKVGVDQSSISRIQSQKFKRSNWQTVERIQSLYQHICIESKSIDDFLDYENYINQQSTEGA